MDKSLEKNIQRIKRIGLSCTLNDNGKLRHFHNGHEYIEIGGIKWATCNVGAEKPTDNGLYFAWGDTQGYTTKQVMKGEKRFVWGDYKYGNCDFLTKYNNFDKKTVLELLDDAATFNMGVGWRMPSRDEFKILFDSTTSTWITNYKGSGVNGMLFTDKTGDSKALFFPAVGICGNGSVYDVGSNGYFLSSLLNTDNLKSVFNLSFGNGGVYWDDNGRCLGFAVRGVVG